MLCRRRSRTSQLFLPTGLGGDVEHDDTPVMFFPVQIHEDTVDNKAYLNGTYGWGNRRRRLKRSFFVPSIVVVRLQLLEYADFKTIVTGRALNGQKSCKADLVTQFTFMATPNTLGLGLLVHAIHINDMFKSFAFQHIHEATMQMSKTRFLCCDVGQ